MDNFWTDAEVISVYTRAEAIADGALVDVTDTAKETGIRVPVAVTRAVWAEYVTPSEESKTQEGQSIAGRLWDILNMFRIGALRNRDCSSFLFTVLLIMKTRQRRNVQFKAVIGPGDSGEPVLTISMPNED